MTYHRKKFGDNFQVNIRTYEDYLKVFYDTGSALAVSKLVFNKSFNRELDIFGTQFLAMNSAFISERLLVKFQESKITGYIARFPIEEKQRAEFIQGTYTELIFE